MSFTILSCSDKNDVNEISQEEMANLFNAQMDLANLMTRNFSPKKLLDGEGLIGEDHISHLYPTSTYPHRFRISFPSGFLDPNGNTLGGSFIYNLSSLEPQVGALEKVEYKGFTINGARIDGEKIASITSMDDSSIHIDWCTNGIKITTQDSTELRSHGCLDKKLNTTTNRVLINGFNYGYINNRHRVDFDIIQPLEMDMSCRWFDRGLVQASSRAGEAFNLLYDQAGCNSQYVMDCNDCDPSPTDYHYLWE